MPHLDDPLDPLGEAVAAGAALLGAVGDDVPWGGAGEQITLGVAVVDGLGEADALGVGLGFPGGTLGVGSATAGCGSISTASGTAAMSVRICCNLVRRRSRADIGGPTWRLRCPDILASAKMSEPRIQSVRFCSTLGIPV